MTRVAEWRAAGETIVFTKGCFDLLHVGHITLLEDCRRFGSKLVLGVECGLVHLPVEGGLRADCGRAGEGEGDGGAGGGGCGSAVLRRTLRWS